MMKKKVLMYMSKSDVDYWQSRINYSYKKNSVLAQKELKRLYKEQADLIVKEITNLYYNMIGDGGITTTNLYKYGRYKEMLKEIKNVLEYTEDLEIKEMTKVLEQTYIAVLGNPSDMQGKQIVWNLRNDEAIMEVINTSFKGSDFKTRIKRNKRQFLKILKKEVVNAVAGTRALDEVVKVLMVKNGISLREADRLARTEVMRVANTAYIDSAKERGYTKGYYIYTKDNKICEECERIGKETKNKPIPLNELKRNPIHHPNCRCVIQVVTSGKTLKEINAENKNRVNRI